MNGIKEFFGVTEACQAFLEVDHTLVRINWPAEGGSMKGVCGVDSDIAQRPLHCVRGSVKELCELSLAGTQTLQGSLMSMTCSARTIEVYEQKDGSNSYVSTARGKPSASAGLYKHDITLPNAQKVVLRLLSLQQPGSAVLHSLQLLPLPPNATQNETARTKAPSSNSEQQDSQNASSQKTQVAAMLQSMMATGPPGSSASSDSALDAQQKLVAALAKAALGQGPPPKAGGAPWAFGKLRQQQQQSQPQQQQQQQSHKQAQQQQQQSGLPLVQDMSSMQTASQVSTADAAPVLSKPQGHILADHSHDPSEAQLCDQQSINRICARMEALEGASMRIEAKLDQILGCCHLMTGGMVP